MAPPPPRTADQWADQVRILPDGTAEPGPFRSARTPYMIPIVRAFRAPGVKTVIGVLAAQMGKTENVLNVIGHRLDDDPTPILYVSPTQKLTESMSSDRFTKMFRSARSLWDKLAHGKLNKLTEKWVAGVRLGFGWAGSKTELSSHPAGLVMLDERDRMEDVQGEGDPFEMARARISTYRAGCVGVISTPTRGNAAAAVNPESGLEHWADLDTPDEQAMAAASPIWKLWQEGTRREWAWPCPDCGEYFIPRLKHLWWPDGATPAQAKREARLVCPHCGVHIHDERKAAMNARGLYVGPGQRVEQGSAVGDVAANETESFWVSGLASPWKSFGDRARAYVAAVRSGSPGRIRGVVNLEFGELQRQGADVPDWREVQELARPYERGVVAEGGQRLTCGVDVQKNRLVYSVRAWGWRSESWLVEAGELWGETKHPEVWEELDELLDRDFDGQRIRMMLVDSGYNPGERDRNPDNLIYIFCRRHRRRAWPSKGHDTQEKPFKSSKIDISINGKIIKHGLDLWHLDTDYFKSWVHERLDWPEDKPGGWHLHAEVSDEYCRQIVAEARMVSETTGKVLWERIRRENHWLDCEGLNAAAAHILRLHALQRPASLRKADEEDASARPAQKSAKPAPEVTKAAERVEPPRKRPAFPRPRGGFVTGWRR